mgnify:FL=1
MAEKFTVKNFDQEVLSSPVPVLVDFWASWCGPCRMLGPVIDALASEADGYPVGKVNVDEEPEQAERNGVMTIPTVIAFKNGQPAKKSIGVQPKAALKSLLD